MGCENTDVDVFMKGADKNKKSEKTSIFHRGEF
ncbi:hypothetical protein MNBD_GAMMA09-899 [hydrothermal vent metagenome]|uniref:Uncharacterized protein n=1 Tax=hydrothermal vent metagenome TaxID=652676 RepID=A0A3B0XEY0_9ZZZZ